jgi:NAD(P)-dependent dehydrogenase (short-subunit alcohol dehydrogenase family)
MYRAQPADGMVWITGASSGIGKAVALEMARRGYRIAITARRAEQLDEIVKEAQAFGGRITAYVGDVTDPASMEDVISRIESIQGAITFAFLNAGIALYTNAQTLDLDVFQKTYAVNVFGVVNSLAPLLKRMKERGKGQVAVTSSVAGYGGLPRASAYCSSKAAVIALCESLKFDCDRLGITLQVVNPGFVDTPLTQKNDFAMPFLLTMDDAANRTCDGFAKSGFEITYPRRLAWSLKLLNHLPYWLYFWLVEKGTNGKREG